MNVRIFRSRSESGASVNMFFCACCCVVVQYFRRRRQGPVYVWAYCNYVACASCLVLLMPSNPSFPVLSHSSILVLKQSHPSPSYSCSHFLASILMLLHKSHPVLVRMHSNPQSSQAYSHSPHSARRIFGGTKVFQTIINFSRGAGYKIQTVDIDMVKNHRS